MLSSLSFSRCLSSFLVCIGIIASPAILLGQQDRLTTSLEELQELAEAQSPQAQIARSQWQVFAYQQKIAQAALKPEIGLTSSLPGITRQIEYLVLDDGTQDFITRSQSFSTANLYVSQAIPMTGGKVTMSSGVFHIRNFGQNNTDLWQSTPLLLQLEQPLFQPNQYRWDIRLAEQQIKVGYAQYVLARQQAVLSATEQYFDALLAQVTSENAALNQLNNDSILQITQQRYELGKVSESSLLQSKQRLLEAENQYQKATIQLQQASVRILTTLIPEQQQLNHLTIPTKWPEILIDLEEAETLALSHSAELQQVAFEKLQQEKNREEVKAENGLQADIVASFGLNQTGANLGDAYRDPIDRQYATIGLSLPIWNGGRRTAEFGKLEVEAQMIQQRQESRTNQTLAEVRHLMLSLDQLEQQLVTAKTIDELAGQRYVITLERYKNGRVSLQELFLAQQEKDLTSQTYLYTLREGWINFERLQLLLLTDLDLPSALSD